MFRAGSFLVRFLLALLLIGMLATGGYMLFQAGQAQGYALGLQAAGQEGQPAAPEVYGLPYYYPGYLHSPHFFFFPFGPLLGFLFWGLLIFFVFRGVFHRRNWAGPGHHHAYPPHWPQGQPWQGWAGREAPPQPGEPPKPE